MVEDLPPDQRGWLLSALCVYAERVWRDPSVTMEEILDHYPQMSGQTRIACGFLGAAVLRDTQRWLSQRQARALRRQKELEAKGQARPYSEVLADVMQRDEQDSTRASAPLRQAEDAVRLDTTYLNFEESFVRLREIICRRAGL